MSNLIIIWKCQYRIYVDFSDIFFSVKSRSIFRIYSESKRIFQAGYFYLVLANRSKFLPGHTRYNSLKYLHEIYALLYLGKQKSCNTLNSTIDDSNNVNFITTIPRHFTQYENTKNIRRVKMINLNI